MIDAARQRSALAMMLAGAAIIGTNGLMVRLAATPPTVTAFWRMLLSALLLAALVQLRHGWQPMSRRAWLWLAVPAVAFACDLWMWHRSILAVGPGLATLLANAQVFFMVAAGAAFFGERIGPRFLLGLALAFAGLWLLLAGDWEALPDGYRWGVWLGLATGVAYAFYNIGIARTQAEAAHAAARAPVEQVLCLASLGSALCLGAMAMAEGSAFAIPDLRTAGILLALAAFGHCLSWILISRAMAVLAVALVGLLLLLQPIVAYLIDVAFFGVQPTPRQWLGLALSLAGIFVAGLKSRLAQGDGVRERA